jgi:hypothetical protein
MPRFDWVGNWVGDPIKEDRALHKKEQTRSNSQNGRLVDTQALGAESGSDDLSTPHAAGSRG